MIMCENFLALNNLVLSDGEIHNQRDKHFNTLPDGRKIGKMYFLNEVRGRCKRFNIIVVKNECQREQNNLNSICYEQ